MTDQLIEIEAEDECVTPKSDFLEDHGEEEATVAKKAAAKTKKKRRGLKICLENCKYESVRRVARRFGLKEAAEDEDWNVYWTDTSVGLERVMEMKRYQKINHFPGMSEICRKDLLARNMNRMFKLFPKEYRIFPRSWCLPADYGDFQAFCRQKKNKTYIAKPDSGCQGKGIFVTKNPKDIKPGEHMICQQYLSKPFTLDGFKFDLRIYVLVTRCDPLRIFVYKDGLARFATVKYVEPTASNVGDVCMHLTNYAINKHSKDFVRDDNIGSKRRIVTVNRWFEENNYPIDKIWADIEDVIIKTIIACHPVLKHNYRSCFAGHSRTSACFEILGFDVMLDRKLKPWLLEVNHSPSFHTDAPLDKEVKEGLLHDTFTLLNLNANEKRRCIEEDRKRVKERLLYRHKPKDMMEEDEQSIAKYEEELKAFEDCNRGGFRRIYPENNNEVKYSELFEQSSSLCAETAASKARNELARQQREEIESKKKDIQQSKMKCSKSDNLRPESPTRVPIRRYVPPRKHLMPYRLPATLQQTSGKQSPLPVCESTQPISIREDDELQRLAALQQRDSLIRSTGLTDHLHKLLSAVSNPTHVDHVALEESKKSATAITLDILDKELVASLSRSCPPQTMLLSSVHPSQLPGHSALSYYCNPRYTRHNLQVHPLTIQRGLSNESNCSAKQNINYRHSVQPDPGGIDVFHHVKRTNKQRQPQQEQQRSDVKTYHLPLCPETFGLSIVSAPTQFSRVQPVVTSRQLLDVKYNKSQLFRGVSNEQKRKQMELLSSATSFFS